MQAPRGKTLGENSQNCSTNDNLRFAPIASFSQKTSVGRPMRTRAASLPVSSDNPPRVQQQLRSSAVALFSEAASTGRMASQNQPWPGAVGSSPLLLIVPYVG